MPNPTKALVIGELSRDFRVTVRGAPNAIKWDIDRVEELFGGSGANVCAAYLLSGASPVFLTSLSEQEQAIAREIAEKGVRVFATQCGKVSKIRLYHFNNGERKIVIEKGGPFEQPPDFHLVEGQEFDLVHISSVPLKLTWDTVNAFPDKFKVLSPNAELVEETDPFELQRLLRSVDAVVVNEYEARAYARTEDLFEALDLLSKHTTAVVTLSNKGALCKINDEATLVPAFKIDEVDTNGCGDTFAAAFGKAFYETRDVERAVTKATLAAAYMATIKGMWRELLTGMDPTRLQAMELMDCRPKAQKALGKWI